MPEQRSPVAVVEEYFAHFAARRYHEGRPLLHDRLSFQGPLDTFDNADDFLAAVSRLGPVTKEVRRRKLFADGADVCIIYDFEVHPPGGTVLIAEWFHVTDGKIDSIRILFDPRPFIALFHP
jgi:hypothetical protein